MFDHQPHHACVISFDNSDVLRLLSLYVRASANHVEYANVSNQIGQLQIKYLSKGKVYLFNKRWKSMLRNWN